MDLDPFDIDNFDPLDGMSEEERYQAGCIMCIVYVAVIALIIVLMAIFSQI